MRKVNQLTYQQRNALELIQLAVGLMKHTAEKKKKAIQLQV